jgi:hypothetical protein
MTTNRSDTGLGPTLQRYADQAWRDVLSVYYANTPTWRWLKSGTLVFFGLFLWSGSGLLLSYRPDWTPLTYTMAYGFVLIVWGPLTHFLVVPGVIRLRRTAQHPLVRKLARHGSKLNLSVFLVIVVVFGAVTPGVMMLDFAGALETGGATNTISADVNCDTAAEPVSCTVEVDGEVASVVVTSGGETLRTFTAPPYSFELQREELTETDIGRQFVVELRDEDGNTLRRFVQTVPA